MHLQIIIKAAQSSGSKFYAICDGKSSSFAFLCIFYVRMFESMVDFWETIRFYGWCCITQITHFTDFYFASYKLLELRVFTDLNTMSTLTILIQVSFCKISRYLSFMVRPNHVKGMAWMHCSFQKVIKAMQPMHMTQNRNIATDLFEIV